jgi:aerobic-type carbon monoxide dehydrogenase small subunit (CoxS/CutS family)
MTKRLITLTVNGERKELAVEPYWTLAEVLREQLGLTGLKIGCDAGGRFLFDPGGHRRRLRD